MERILSAAQELKCQRLPEYLIVRDAEDFIFSLEIPTERIFSRKYLRSSSVEGFGLLTAMFGLQPVMIVSLPTSLAALHPAL